ncbi:hypothetical protein V4Y02_23935, partial [Escherichia coli]
KLRLFWRVGGQQIELLKRHTSFSIEARNFLVSPSCAEPFWTLISDLLLKHIPFASLDFT